MHTRIAVATALLLAVAVATPAAAQRGRRGGGPRSGDRPDIAISYSLMHDNELSETFPVGWVFALGAPVSRNVSVIAEAGGNYKSQSVAGTTLDLSVHTILGGFRIRASGRQARPFAQLGVGWAHANAGALGFSTGADGFAVQPGGGVDVRMTDRTDFRFQADYRWIHNSNGSGNEFRVALGVVFRLGR